MKLSEMSNEELDVSAATEIMGWVLDDHQKYGLIYRNAAGKIEHVWGSGDWCPTRCRNLSKLVRDAAYAKTDAPLDPSFDPREEVIQAIEAVRAKGGN